MLLDDFEGVQYSQVGGNDNPVQTTSVRPFLRIDNHLVPINRIIEIGFIPTGIIYEVDSNMYFDEYLAKEDAHQRGIEITEKKTSILVILFLDMSNKLDYIRRHSEEAEKLWKYLTDDLAFSYVGE